MLIIERVRRKKEQPPVVASQVDNASYQESRIEGSRIKLEKKKAKQEAKKAKKAGKR